MNYRCETDLAAIKDYLQNAVVVAFDFETAPLLQYRDDSRAALDAHRACIVEFFCPLLKAAPSISRWSISTVAMQIPIR